MSDRWMKHVRAIANDHSEDPVTQVGAAVVRFDQALAIGWNHFPFGTPKEYWHDKKLKLSHVVHAEIHAIFNAGRMGCKSSLLYCTHHPCRECALLIVDSGIGDVYCPEWNGAGSKDSAEAAKKIFERGGVELHYTNYKEG